MTSKVVCVEGIWGTFLVCCCGCLVSESDDNTECDDDIDDERDMAEYYQQQDLRKQQQKLEGAKQQQKEGKGQPQGDRIQIVHEEEKQSGPSPLSESSSKSTTPILATNKIDRGDEAQNHESTETQANAHPEESKELDDSSARSLC